VTRASRRQSSRTATGTSSRGGAAYLSSDTWRRIWACVGWAFTLALVVWGAVQLNDYVHASQTGVECKLEWASLPPWLAGPSYASVLHQISATADLRPDDDFRDPNLCARVAANLRQSPWIAEVRRVTRQSNGAIRAEATFREPFAYVEVKGVAYLVDKEGVRLPSKTDRLSGTSHDGTDDVWEKWFRITGASGPIPNEGEAWTGSDMAAGLSLVKFLKEATARGEVTFRSVLRAVDVANFTHPETGYGGLRIRTTQPHGWIQWGLPPGEEFAIDAGATRKLELLRSCFGTQGGQFADGAIYDVQDARGDRVKIREYKGG
jgi:hypothetical protein